MASPVSLSLPEALFWAVVAGCFTALTLYDLLGVILRSFERLTRRKFRGVDGD
jgi:hypothetical protein